MNFALGTCILAAACVSCSATREVRQFVKAKPTQLTPFLEDFEHIEMSDGRGPFHAVWVAADQENRAVSARRREIYIAPVETRYLRPIGKELAARQQRVWGRRRPAQLIARKLQREFVSAFINSPDARYVPVSSPTSDSVTLRLALVELDPTSVEGNTVKKAAGFFIGPAAGLAGRFTKGSIAIEGQLRDTEGGWLLLQFADKEHDKKTLWTLRDFRPYGHAEVAIREWAKQFERATRDPGWREMGDSRAWTLMPW